MVLPLPDRAGLWRGGVSPWAMARPMALRRSRPTACPGTDQAPGKSASPTRPDSTGMALPLVERAMPWPKRRCANGEGAGPTHEPKERGLTVHDFPRRVLLNGRTLDRSAVSSEHARREAGEAEQRRAGSASSRGPCRLSIARRRSRLQVPVAPLRLRESGRLVVHEQCAREPLNECSLGPSGENRVGLVEEHLRCRPASGPGRAIE